MTFHNVERLFEGFELVVFVKNAFVIRILVLSELRQILQGQKCINLYKFKAETVILGAS